jgi:DNA-binding response OmpR family regulator
MVSTTATDPATVLLVEDDQDIAYVVRFILERERYRVMLARNGREALALLEGAPAQLIILDVMLPFVDGFEILKQVRATPAWVAVPVIMLTARSQETDIVRALDAGANDYVVKPFKPEELLARVRRLVRPPG